MAREIVTSENREEYNNKKMGVKSKEKSKKDYSKMLSKDRPHGIWHSETNKLHSHHENEEKAMKVYNDLGQKMADHAIGELSSSERKQYGYE